MNEDQEVAAGDGPSTVDDPCDKVGRVAIPFRLIFDPPLPEFYPDDNPFDIEISFWQNIDPAKLQSISSTLYNLDAGTSINGAPTLNTAVENEEYAPNTTFDIGWTDIVPVVAGTDYLYSVTAVLTSAPNVPVTAGLVFNSDDDILYDEEE